MLTNQSDEPHKQRQNP